MIQNRIRKLTHRVPDGYRLADDEEELRQEGHMPRSWMTIEGTLSTLQGSGDNEENNRQHLHRCALLPVAVHDNDANEPAPVPPRGKEDGYHSMTDSGRTTTTQATTPVNMIIQQHTCEDLVTTTASTAEDLNDSGLAQQQLITITEESVLVVGHSFGRPKGTTVASAREVKERVKLATAEAATEYKIVRDRAKMENKRATRGLLTKIVAAAKHKYRLDASTVISIATVWTRAQRNKLNPAINRGGTPSPMLTIEPYIVELILQLARMRLPINVTTGLQLAKSIIAGTSFEIKVNQWKQKHNVHARQQSVVSVVDGDGGEEDKRQCLGWGYWCGFMKQNGHLIKSKKAVKCEAKCADWCTYQNFSTMYEEVYDEMAKGGIAMRLGTDKVFLDCEGHPTTDETQASGLPTQYMMRHPDKLLFVDEVG
jgi:hypothetical protein